LLALVYTITARQPPPVSVDTALTVGKFPFLLIVYVYVYVVIESVMSQYCGFNSADGVVRYITF
jgi:hypothetical protein